MKIGLVSDVHATPAPLADAINIFRREDVDRIICAGDIAGYNDDLSSTIDLLIDNEVNCIIGNHDQSWLAQHPELQDNRDYRFLNGLPPSLQFEVSGTRVFIVHAEPPDGQHGGIKLLDIDSRIIPEQAQHWQDELENYPLDILIVGHTHQVYKEQLGDVLLINPGSSTYNHSCMILTLPERTVDTFELQDKEIKKVWNWGMQVNSHS